MIIPLNTLLSDCFPTARKDDSATVIARSSEATAEGTTKQSLLINNPSKYPSPFRLFRQCSY
jgi:hypothetical protein